MKTEGPVRGGVWVQDQAFAGGVGVGSLHTEAELLQTVIKGDHAKA